MRPAILCFTISGILGLGIPHAQEAHKGIRLESLSWVEAESVLRPESVVVIPLGAALKEHGPHLKLRNDLTLAEYFAQRVLAAAPVVVTPPLTYHFYPAFLEYPGSTSLTLDTARELTIQVARSLARYGPRRFYVLNTGISTLRALEPAAEALAREGILLRYTDFGGHLDRITAQWKQQPQGSHADEIETSMMLYIEPASVDMKLAVRDIAPRNGAFTRTQGSTGTYSPSGIWGDPTLATPEKGRAATEGMVNAMLQDLAALRAAAPPQPSAPAPSAPPPPAPIRPLAPPRPSGGSGCLPGVERDIKALEAAFHLHWNNHDALELGALWSMEGDLVHPDGGIEKGRRAITQNRLEQFRSREFRAAKHALTFGIIRCLDAQVALVDAKWDLREVTDAAGKAVPKTEGFATLVLGRGTDGWLIEAYRYHVKPGAPPVPTLLKKPGYPDKE